MAQYINPAGGGDTHPFPISYTTGLQAALDAKQAAATAATDTELADEASARSSADSALSIAIGGKASTSHTHDESDVTSLVTDLAAKVPKSLADAKGDLLVATANDTVARLPVGADGQVLTADSAEAAGVKWRTDSRDIAAARALMPMPLFALTSTAASASGTMQGTYLYAGAATPVANLAAVLTVAAAATPTISRIGVFVADPENGQLLSLAAATANDTALFTTTGLRRSPPTSGAEVSSAIWTPTLGRYYFIGALCVSGAALPTFVSGGTLTAASFNIGGSLRSLLAATFVGLADLPAAFPLAVSSTAARAAVCVGEY